MAKINDYPNKTYSQLVANADSFICSNGTDEYNVTIEELFNYHLNITDHDLSPFVTDAEAHSIAQGEAQTISDNGITAYNTFHLSDKEHHTTIEITGLAVTAASSAISQHLIDADHPSFIEDLSNVTVSNVSDGDVLIFSSGYGWINGAAASVPTTLDDLSDIVFYEGPYGPEIYNNQVLLYDAGSMVWRNGNVPAPSMSINDLTDVTVPAPESGPQNDGDVLTWNSTYNQWVPWPASGASGWTGSFYIQSGQQVTVVNGLITDVSIAA